MGTPNKRISTYRRDFSDRDKKADRNSPTRLTAKSFASLLPHPWQNKYLKECSQYTDNLRHTPEFTIQLRIEFLSAFYEWYLFRLKQAGNAQEGKPVTYVCPEVKRLAKIVHTLNDLRSRKALKTLQADMASAVFQVVDEQMWSIDDKQKFLQRLREKFQVLESAHRLTEKTK